MEAKELILVRDVVVRFFDPLAKATTSPEEARRLLVQLGYDPPGRRHGVPGPERRGQRGRRADHGDRGAAGGPGRGGDRHGGAAEPPRGRGDRRGARALHDEHPGQLRGLAVPDADRHRRRDRAQAPRPPRRARARGLLQDARRVAGARRPDRDRGRQGRGVAIRDGLPEADRALGPAPGPVLGPDRPGARQPHQRRRGLRLPDPLPARRARRLARPAGRLPVAGRAGPAAVQRRRGPVRPRRRRPAHDAAPAADRRPTRRPRAAAVSGARRRDRQVHRHRGRRELRQHDRHPARRSLPPAGQAQRHRGGRPWDEALACGRLHVLEQPVLRHPGEPR